jgi:tetratricopeptide (TPR) repeat protein
MQIGGSSRLVGCKLSGVSESFKEMFARGYRARAENQPVESRAIFIEAVRRAATEADPADLAESLCGLAQAERDLENLPAASHHYNNAARLYRQLDLPERLAYSLRHEADILREMTRYADAEPLFLEAAGIYRGMGETANLELANTLRGLALLHEVVGKPDASRAEWREARELYAKSNVDAGVAEADRKLRQ